MQGDPRFTPSVAILAQSTSESFPYLQVGCLSQPDVQDLGACFLVFAGLFAGTVDTHSDGVDLGMDAADWLVVLERVDLINTTCAEGDLGRVRSPIEELEESRSVSIPVAGAQLQQSKTLDSTVEGAARPLVTCEVPRSGCRCPWARDQGQLCLHDALGGRPSRGDQPPTCGLCEAECQCACSGCYPASDDAKECGGRSSTVDTQTCGADLSTGTVDTQTSGADLITGTVDTDSGGADLSTGTGTVDTHSDEAHLITGTVDTQTNGGVDLSTGESDLPDFALKWIAREMDPRPRSRSPHHVPVLPILQPARSRRFVVAASVPSPFTSMNTPSTFAGVNSPLGALCWRALVGRDRGSSLAGPNVFMMSRGDRDDVSAAAQHSDAVVRKIVARRKGFYVGITRDPARRWEQHQLRRIWSHMTIVVEARDSSLSRAVEMQILLFWRGNQLCWNASGGGESATPGSPHYVYVLEAIGSTCV